MNYNRRRNIFTLSDFQPQLSPPRQILKAHRRQNCDPFERDPFKIQSYNFHYADRPTYPLKSTSNRPSVNYSSLKNFDTYYVNHDFAAARNDKENTPASKFNEFRRRKLLHEQQLQAHSLGASVFSHSQSQQTATGVESQQQYGQHQGGGGFNYGGRPSSQDNASQHQSSSQQPLYPLASATGAGVVTGGIGGDSSATSVAEVTQRFARPITQQYFNTARTTNTGSATSGLGVNNNASFNSTASQYLRFGGASRDYLSALRGPHPTSIQAAAQIYGGRSRSSSSRTAFGIGEGGGQAKMFERAAGGYAAAPRSSSSERPRRPSLQHLESRPKNLSNTSGHQLHSSSSGCRINININGLDSKQLGDNVTIKIEADDESRGNLKERSSTQISPSKRISASNNRQALSKELPTNNLDKDTLGTAKAINMNIHRQASTSSLNMDKRQSKVKEGIAVKDIHLQRTRSRSDDNIRPHVCGENRPPVRPGAERLPCIMPWRIDENLRQCFAENETHSPYFRPTNLMRSYRTNYDATLTDIRNLRCYAAMTGTDSGARNVQNLCRLGKELPPAPAFKAEEGKLLNTTAPRHKLASPITTRATRRLASKSPLEVKTLNTRAMTATAVGPCSSPGGPNQKEQLSGSRQSLKPPFNVNINVYADKLKLLRV